MPDTIRDETYEHRRGSNRRPPLEVPFRRDDGEFSITCIHAHATIGLITNEISPDGALVAVVAMHVKDEPTGIYAHFDAEGCRAQAKALQHMADYIDKENQQ
jgi:hypothetical protein